MGAHLPEHLFFSLALRVMINFPAYAAQGLSLSSGMFRGWQLPAARAVPRITEQVAKSKNKVHAQLS
jgi:hypothetical protein